MSKEVKRYNFSVDKCGSPRSYASEHGRWMKRADYESLRAQADRLREALVTAREWIDFSKGAVGGGGLILEEIDAALQGEQT